MKSKIQNPKSDLLRILILEDVSTDAELVEHELRKAGIAFTSRWVDTREAFLEQLADFSPDIVISDYSLPHFNGMEALELVQERFAFIPLIIVTGSINEETAVECMKAGADDYVLKENLTRIGMAVNGSLERKRLQQEKERAEQSVKASARKWRTTFDAMSDCVCLLDLKGTILQSNKAMADFLKRPFQEIIGRRCSKLVCGTSEPIEGCPLVRMQETGCRENMVFAKDGRWLEVTVDPVVDEDGGIVNAVHVLSDITERKEIEEEKHRLIKQLERAQKMEAVGTLAGGIAHDFNNILMAIMGYTEMTKAAIPNESGAHEMLEEVLKAGYRAKDLIKQILRFSRQSKEEKMPLKISLIVKEVSKLLRASFPATIEIRQENSAHNETVLADPIQIHQVMMNLCTNAYQAMGKKGGILKISLSDVDFDSENAFNYTDLQPGSYVKLTVSDTGCGMDQNTLERIFNPYFTTKEIGVGTGMGLAVVHGIVKTIGGKITVQSEPGKGSTFQILFPLLETEPKQVVAGRELCPRGNERILFVDDEEPIMDLGRRMLLHLGYEVVALTSSMEALAVFREKPEKFDLVITDQTMPGMTGEMLTREVTSLRSDIPVILCTGFSEHITAEKAKTIGVRGFLLKPMLLKDIAQTIRGVLDE